MEARKSPFSNHRWLTRMSPMNHIQTLLTFIILSSTLEDQESIWSMLKNIKKWCQR